MRRRRKALSIIDIANERVSILTACRILGMDLPDGYAGGRAMKVRCPFGKVYHRDQGVEPAMRIYVDSNHTWCFACASYGTPVSLVAQEWDVDQHSAAVALLERAGYRPASQEQAWAQACSVDTAPERAQLAEALKTYCARIAGPRWAMAQFDSAVAAMLTRCLTLLDVVRTESDAQRWLSGCKQAMATTLQPSSSCDTASR